MGNRGTFSMSPGMQCSKGQLQRLQQAPQHAILWGVALETVAGFLASLAWSAQRGQCQRLKTIFISWLKWKVSLFTTQLELVLEKPEVYSYSENKSINCFSDADGLIHSCQIPRMIIDAKTWTTKHGCRSLMESLWRVWQAKEVQLLMPWQWALLLTTRQSLLFPIHIQLDR